MHAYIFTYRIFPAINSTLYIVATPIGNLADFSERAVQVLNQADLIACEDTRTSSTLLRHYGIEKPTISFHQHNEHTRVDKLMDELRNGRNIAIISDAGMPGISDPGFLAVRQAHRNGIRVVTIPGPSAAVSALVASGLPCDRFVFEGFLPQKKGRQTRLKLLAAEERTLIVFESPHRIIKLVDEIVTHFGPDRLMAVARELTKKFEEIIRAPASEVKKILEDRASVKGEIVVVVAGTGYKE
ncbi:MAG: 16S rRNA (cytidine(1402)-2'-O)-methyltransferase [Balneolales bacterium]